MIIGRAEVFAIESHISRAYEELGLRALGFFNLLIKGRRFGVLEEDATMLANSYDEVCRRIAGRGQHTGGLGFDGSPADIAYSVVNVLYGVDVKETVGLPGQHHEDLAELIHKNRLVWAPDGDAAFDDRSLVLHFDLGDQVRLIAFKRGEQRLFEPSSVVDQRLTSDEFYTILEEWRDGFVREWERHPKESRVT